jgi:antitoxin component of MazEF toxin-antitoxin module
MRGPLKLSKNGNATYVAVPKDVLAWLGWRTGTYVWYEVREDKTIIIRKPRPEDFSVRTDAAPAPVGPAEVLS